MEPVFSNLEELNRHLKKVMEERNSAALDDFDGFSPNQMRHLLYDPLGDESPVQLKNDLSASALDGMPFLRLTEAFLNVLKVSDSIKLTSTGSLPVKFVGDLYAERFITDWFLDNSKGRILEHQWAGLMSVRAVCDLAGLTSKRKGHLSLTKKGLKLISPDKRTELFRELITTFCLDFNWGYADYYGDHAIGQFGFAYSLCLLIKYGDLERDESFYAEKYIKAFPTYFEQCVFNDSYGSRDRMIVNCFSLRFFERFGVWFGLATVNDPRKFDTPTTVKALGGLREVFGTL